MSGPLTFQKTSGKKGANWWLTTVLVILIAITVMGILTAKKYFEVGRTVDPNEVVVDQLNEIIKENPNSVEAMAALAFQYQKNGDFDSAKEQYNEVLKIDPKNPGALYNMAVIAKEMQDEKASEEWYKKLLKERPSHLLGAVGLGNLYVEQKKADEAIKLIDGAMKYTAAFDKVELYIIRAKAYELKGDKVKAKQNYNTALKYVPDNKEAKAGLEKLK